MKEKRRGNAALYGRLHIDRVILWKQCHQILIGFVPLDHIRPSLSELSVLECHEALGRRYYEIG